METKYFYAENGLQFGPFTKEELRTRHISPNTLVWHAGMPDWVPARKIDELGDLFAVPTPPPIPQDNPIDSPDIDSYKPEQSGNGIAKTLKILCIVGIVFAGLMHIFGWVMLLDRDRSWGYYGHIRGIDSEWGLLYMMVSIFFLVFCILRLIGINRQLKKN